MGNLLYIIVAVLVVLWLAGWLLAHITSPLIHLVLVVAVIILIYQLVTGKRSV